jgi:hypothetical protein
MTREPFGGIQVRVTDLLPRVLDGFTEKRIPGHPLILWLSRWLPIDPWIVMAVPKTKPADPIYDRENGVIYCAPEHYRQIRMAIDGH